MPPSRDFSVYIYSNDGNTLLGSVHFYTDSPLIMSSMPVEYRTVTDEGFFEGRPTPCIAPASLYAIGTPFDMTNYGGISTVPNATVSEFELDAGDDLSPSLQNYTYYVVPKNSTLNVTYNSQKIIDSFDVSVPVDVTYDGQTIASMADGDTISLLCGGKTMASDVQIGSKTLKCSGKYMASDIRIHLGEEIMPVKGSIIRMNLGNGYQQYRVMKMTGATTAFCVAMQGIYTQFDESSNVYSGSDLDILLNETLYNDLSAGAKRAIIATDINQYKYKNGYSEYSATTHASTAEYSTKALLANVGSRNVFALDVEDVEEYFGGTAGSVDLKTAGTFSIEDIWALFWNTTEEPSEGSPWLRSSDLNSDYGVFYVNSHYGRIELAGAFGYIYAHPAFVIDLSKITFRIIE